MGASRKAGHWREYYPGGNVKSEMVYDGNGMRCGFCKRYGEDGTVLWVKDYTKEYQARVDDFNTRKGLVDLSSIDEAAQLLGFKDGKMPQADESRRCAASVWSEEARSSGRLFQCNGRRKLVLGEAFGFKSCRRGNATFDST